MFEYHYAFCSPLYCKRRVDPKVLAHLSSSFFRFSQLRICGRGNHMGATEAWRPRHAFLQLRQCVRVLSKHVINQPHTAGHVRWVKWIEPHMGIEHLNSPCRLSRK